MEINEIALLPYDKTPEIFKLKSKEDRVDNCVIFNDSNINTLEFNSTLEICDVNTDNTFRFVGINKKTIRTGAIDELKVRLVVFKNCKNLKIDFLGKCYLPELIFENCQIEKISLNDITVGTSGIVFIGKCTIGDFETEHCTINGMLQIEDIEHISRLEINDTNFSFNNTEHMPHGYREGIRISRSKIDFLRLNNVNLSNNGISFVHSEILNGLLIDSSKSGDKSKLGNVFFEGIWSKECSLSFEKLQCSTLNFIKFRNYGDLSFIEVKNSQNDVKDGGFLKLHTSDLGQTQFIDCSLDKWKFDFRDSRLLDVSIISCKLPTDSIHKDSKFKAPFDFPQQRSLYSQLRQVYESGGDRVKAILYQRLSSDAYLNQLLNQNKDARKWADLFSLILNKHSNEFGYNLGKATFSLCLSSSVLYFLYLFALNNICWCNIDWNLVWQWFEFINPVRKTDFLNPALKITPSARFLDGISRLLITYLLYQFIQSFRKFGRNT